MDIIYTENPKTTKGILKEKLRGQPNVKLHENNYKGIKILN